MGLYLFSFFFSIVNAFACAHLAKARGRNPNHWFLYGILFGLFALGFLFFLPARRIIKVASAKARPPQEPLPLRALAPTQAEKLWYYLDREKKQFGPMSFQRLSMAWHEGTLSLHSLVWNEELENWKRLDEVVDFLRSSAEAT